MSRCAACNKVLNQKELAMPDRFFKQEPNDLCSNCRGIVGNPDWAEWIDKDGANTIFHQDECPSPEDRDGGDWDGW